MTAAFYIAILLILAGIYLYLNHKQYTNRKSATMARTNLRSSIGTIRSKSSPVMKQLHLRGSNTRSPANKTPSTANSSPLFFNGTSRGNAQNNSSSKSMQSTHSPITLGTQSTPNVDGQHHSTSTTPLVFHDKNFGTPIEKRTSMSTPKNISTPTVSTPLKFSFTAPNEPEVSKIIKLPESKKRDQPTPKTKLSAPKTKASVVKKGRSTTKKTLEKIDANRVQPLQEVKDTQKPELKVKEQKNDLLNSSKKRKHDEEKSAESQIFWIGPKLDKRMKLDQESIVKARVDYFSVLFN